jgi:hypothetical protein
MNVKKYRSVAGMPAPERVSSRRNLAAIIRAVWGRSRKLAPPVYTPGVQKFRSVEDSSARDPEQSTAHPARAANRLKHSLDRRWPLQ